MNYDDSALVWRNLRAEVERLKEDIKRVRDERDRAERSEDVSTEENDALRAEVERLQDDKDDLLVANELLKDKLAQAEEALKATIRGEKP